MIRATKRPFRNAKNVKRPRTGTLRQNRQKGEEIEKSGSTRPAQKDIADNAVRGISDKEEARR